MFWLAWLSYYSLIYYFIWLNSSIILSEKQAKKIETKRKRNKIVFCIKFHKKRDKKNKQKYLANK